MQKKYILCTIHKPYCLENRRPYVSKNTLCQSTQKYTSCLVNINYYQASKASIKVLTTS
jgi:hypothetical protein